MNQEIIFLNKKKLQSCTLPEKESIEANRPVSTFFVMLRIPSAWYRFLFLNKWGMDNGPSSYRC